MISDIVNGQTISTSIWNNFIHEEAINNGYVINIPYFESGKEWVYVTLTKNFLPDIKFYVDEVKYKTNINTILLLRRRGRA